MKDKTPVKKQDAWPLDISLPDENRWISFYAISRHWKSDLIFFEDELNFLRLLIDKHLSVLSSNTTTNPVHRLVLQVSELEKEQYSLLKKIEIHILRIEALVENSFAHNAQEYKDDHQKLETEFAAFVKKYRTVKDQVFRMTESVIRSKK